MRDSCVALCVVAGTVVTKGLRSVSSSQCSLDIRVFVC